MNNIFNQFIPTTITLIPITLVGSTLALSWLTLTPTTHWSNKRTKNFFKQLEAIFLKTTPIKKNTQKTWKLWLFTTFLLILRLNVYSLIPYTFAPTSHLSITFRLSIPLWIIIKILGFFINWKKKIRHLVPQGTPTPLIPFMIIIETIRLLIQPLTLGFRLGAKLLAGHLLIFLCSCVVWEAINLRPLGKISFILLLTLFILEIAVAFIQAGVFLILLKQYLEENST